MTLLRMLFVNPCRHPDHVDIVEEIWNNNKRFHFIQREEVQREEGSAPATTPSGFGALTKTVFRLWHQAPPKTGSEEPPTPSLKEIIVRRNRGSNRVHPRRK